MSTSRFDKFKTHLPDWVQDWLDIIVPGAQILLIIGAAWLLLALGQALIIRAFSAEGLTAELIALFCSLLAAVARGGGMREPTEPARECATAPEPLPAPKRARPEMTERSP